jgi:single-strand DNA-binding protein
MLNSVVLMGRLGAAPEPRTTQNGTSVLTFSLAVERDFAGQDGKRPVDWITCVAWRQTADFIVKYFDKGDQIAVTGRLQVRPWTDQQGNKRTATEVVVDSAYFAGAKRTQQAPPPADADGYEFEEYNGELPF